MTTPTPARLGKHLPTAAAVRKAVELARELGLDPAGFEVAPGGTIRILGARAFPAPAPSGNAFDQWKAQDPNRDRPARR